MTVIEGLSAGVRAARKLSVRVGVVGVDIEIVLSELGLITRGKRFAGDVQVGASLELDWAEFEANPLLLVTQVRLVNDALLSQGPKETTDENR